MINWIEKLDTGLLIAILGLGLAFYRQWRDDLEKAEQEKKKETDMQISLAKQSTRERVEIKKDVSFIKEKLTFVLDWISSKSGFRNN